MRQIHPHRNIVKVFASYQPYQAGKKTLFEGMNNGYMEHPQHKINHKIPNHRCGKSLPVDGRVIL